MISFGPIPSRRLGSSLGINNIPHKYCSYGCAYCQIGHTNHMSIIRQKFYGPEKIFRDVYDWIRQVRGKKQPIDYLSFVPDGEPTLDMDLGREIRLLRPLGYRIAVFTNGALLTEAAVRQDLMNADLVSLKIDAMAQKTWRLLDRPHGHLNLQQIREGMLQFAAEFSGKLITETMLVDQINDRPPQLKPIGKFLRQLQPDTAYITAPTRPPAEPWACPPTQEQLRLAYEILSELYPKIECLFSEKEAEFGFTGNAEADLLRTTAVQPMSYRSVEALLAKDKAGWDTIYRLIARGDLREVRYRKRRFYVRRFDKKNH